MRPVRPAAALLAAILALGGLSGCADPVQDRPWRPPAAPPALPDHGQSYAHRVMNQSGFSFADVETPSGAPRWSTVFGFMPAAVAGDAETARQTFDRMVIDALAGTLKKTDLGGHGIRPEPLVLDEIGQPPIASLRFDVTGGACENAGMRCAYAAPVLDRPALGTAPAVSGVDGSAWWVGSRWFGPAARSELTGPEPLFRDLGLWQDVSLALPDWAFIYLAPGTAAFTDPRTGQQRFNPWPLLVHDGCVYRFGPRGSPIRKEAELRTAAR